jgi:integrase
LDGRDHYLGPYGTKISRDLYDQLVGEWQAKGRHLPQAAGQITVVEMVRQFWEHAKTHYADADGNPTSHVAHFKAALDPLVRLYRETPASKFGPLALEALRNEYVGKGWSRTYINSQVGKVKLFFRWAVGRQLIEASVHAALEALPGLRQGKSKARETDPVGPVDDAVVDATLAHLSSVVGAMVQLQRLTGARPGEICTMKVGEIDRSGKTWKYTPATHKNAHRGHGRTIFIGPQGQIVLAPFLMTLDPSVYVFSPVAAVAERRHERAESRKTPLNEGNTPGSTCKRNPRRQAGDHYTANSFRRAVANAAAAGLPRWHPHQLRHNAATAIREKFGIEAAQGVLGHRSIKASEIYAEKSTSAAREVAAQIG